MRLIDALREDTEFDVPIGDAERIVGEIVEWGTRAGTEQMPRPVTKVVDEQRREVSGMMHLDELLLRPSVTEELFFDKVIDGKVYLNGVPDLRPGDFVEAEVTAADDYDLWVG